MELFLDELKKLTDFDDESAYDDHETPEDLAQSMLEKDLKILQHATMPEGITEKVWSFVQLRENFPDIPKVLLVTVFSLLEIERSAVVDLEDLARFLEACHDEPGMEADED